MTEFIRPLLDAAAFVAAGVGMIVLTYLGFRMIDRLVIHGGKARVMRKKKDKAS